MLFVNNHRYFNVQIETRVYIAVGKGWHNCFFCTIYGCNIGKDGVNV